MNKATTMMYIIFWEFLVFYEFFYSPQVKRSVIISHKHGICNLLYKLKNKVRYSILGN